MANKTDQQSATKLRIMRQGARLFAERGYDAVSVREIVEASGVKKPTLYYHFKSKEGLATALLDDFFYHHRQMREDALSQSLEPEELLATHAKSVTEWSQANKDLQLFAFSVWLGRCSLLSQQKFTQDFENNAHRAWIDSLVSGGLSREKATAVRKLYWAQLMLAMLQIARIGKFPEDPNKFAKEIANRALYGALGEKREDR